MELKVIKVKRGHGHGFKKKLVKVTSLQSLKESLIAQELPEEGVSFEEVSEDAPPLVEKPKTPKAKSKEKK